MKPLTVISGIVMASSLAIALGLVVVVGIYIIIGDEAAAVRREIPTLWLNAAIFTVFGGVSVASFYGQLVEKPWRWAAVAAQAVTFAGLVLYYWP